VEDVVSALDFYAGRRVAITGHTGFKGSWLAQILVDAGAEVHGFALPPETSPSHFDQLDLATRIRHTEGDIRDPAVLQAFLAGARPEVVFHLAAQPIVRRSYREPHLTYETNVMGGVNLLEAVRHTDSVSALVFCTSDKCYRNRETTDGYTEDDDLGGHDPYSASKAAVEIVFASYASAFLDERRGFAAATARAGNVIGGGDWSEDRILPDCIRALSTGSPIVIRSPGATRPWQHVLEPLSGYLVLGRRLLEDPDTGGAWNFGPDATSHHSVTEVVERVIAGWGSGEMRVETPTDTPHEAGLLALDCSKAERELDWRPTWSFDDTIATTVEWYRRAHDGESVVDLTREHVDRFLRSGAVLR
jgi:CDP-glucose 4,6-dehydratase